MHVFLRHGVGLHLFDRYLIASVSGECGGRVTWQTRCQETSYNHCS